MRLGETLGEAIETFGTWIRCAEDIGGDQDMLDNNRLVLGWLVELRARRKAMWRDPDDERNAAVDLCSCPGAGLQRWRELRGRPCLIHRDGLTHISEALQPLRERLARQTATAQAEVERELAAMRDCDRCTSPPDQRRWLIGTESLCYGCAVSAVAMPGELVLMLAMAVQQLEVAQTGYGDNLVQLCWLDQAAWERLVLLAELVLAPEPEVKP